ncbi:hypothetical protein N1F89_14780 [Aquibium sp. A9E412]|uniref:hypothetical protein n=1 Tax=Aquibium sp. A9E412 TaxID=2976767 RepID=UPI0025B274AB|nr:hypothetical protein [Aquibium sp. A9E412]MDN2567487.1 hypothetical protein [Aquibium sp. A9E412]
MSLRRFAVTGVAVTLAGMLAAALVAELSRPAGSWSIGVVIPCVFEEGRTCAPPLRR